MDEHQFTTLAHARTSIPSRRHVLTGLAGLGLALGAAGLPERAEAKKKGKGKNTLHSVLNKFLRRQLRERHVLKGALRHETG